MMGDMARLEWCHQYDGEMARLFKRSTCRVGTLVRRLVVVGALHFAYQWWYQWWSHQAQAQQKSCWQWASRGSFPNIVSLEYRIQAAVSVGACLYYTYCLYCLYTPGCCQLHQTLHVCVCRCGTVPRLGLKWPRPRKQWRCWDRRCTPTRAPSPSHMWPSGWSRWVGFM